MTNYKIAVLAGDGIGEEVMAEAIKVLDAVSKKFDINFEYIKANVGGAGIDVEGDPLPKSTLNICENSDAILFGSIGGPKWDNIELSKRPEKGLLRLRKHFDLFANIRPTRVYPALASFSPIKSASKGIDLIIVRELTGGIYFGEHKLSETVATDEMKYTKPEIERVIKVAIDIARKRDNTLCSVDKSNVLACSQLWKKTAEELAEQNKDIKLSHNLVDSMAMHLITKPEQYSTVVTENMFGDILSDAAAATVGSLGLSASASLNSDMFGMYEPAGGSAPDIAGKGIANPIAQILSASMMLRYSLGEISAADAIDKAVEQAIENGARTGDIALPTDKVLSTVQMGDTITKLI